jgi:hypothetical protein
MSLFRREAIVPAPLPAIDLAAPSEIRTATFALG